MDEVAVNIAENIVNGNRSDAFEALVGDEYDVRLLTLDVAMHLHSCFGYEYVDAITALFNLIDGRI